MSIRSPVKSMFIYDDALAHRSAIRFYLLVATGTLLLSIGLYYFAATKEKQSLQASETEQIHTLEFNIRNSFYEAISDLLVIAKQTELFQKTEDSNRRLSDEFISFARVKKHYHQLRFMDLYGNEIVRVDNRQPISVTPVELLQNKSSRYYFRESVILKPGQVYVSPMDLNVEFDKIEIPYHPQIRIITPVLSSPKKKSGIVVINISANYLLQLLQRFDQRSLGQIYMLNKEGYWLYHRDSEKTWGFQLKNRNSFADENPALWQFVRSQNDGQLSQQQGLLTFAKIDGPAESRQEVTARNWWMLDLPDIVYKSGWYLVSVFNEKDINARLLHVRQNFIFNTLLFLLLLLPIAWLWGKRTATHRNDLEKMRTFAKFVENCSEVIYVTDREGKIIFVNSAFCKITGYSVEEALGQTPALLKSGRHPQEFYQLLWNTVSRGDSFSNVFVNKRKDGSLFYEEKDITPIMNERGEVDYFVSTGRDLSRLYAMEEHKMQITSRLSESVSHHFNNLFGALFGYLDLSLQRVKERDLHAAESSLDKSLNTLIRAQELVGKISKVNHQKMSQYPFNDVRKIIQGVIDQFQNSVRSDVAISLSFARNLPEVRADSELIKTAVLALLDNSRQSFTDGGKILVTVDLVAPVATFCENCGEPLNGEYVAIIVEDNGAGIDKSIVGRVFDPFYTTKDSRFLVGKTPGLGLTMVRGITHLHGGHLLLETDENAGTSVSILLPVQRPPDNKRQTARTIMANHVRSDG